MNTEQSPTNLKNRLFQENGFTLIEIMVVVVILGILAAIVAVNVGNRPNDARVVAAQSGIGGIETALELYKLDNGNYPTTDQGLEALVQKPSLAPIPRKWKEGGYLKKGRQDLIDPWGTPYYYLAPGQYNTSGFDLASLGQDALVGGEDYDADITNWDANKR